MAVFNRYNWGDPNMQSLYQNIISDATNLTDPQNTPQLSDQYWNQMQDQAVQGIAGNSATQQNAMMEQLARRGLANSGAAGAGIAALMNQDSANRASVLRDLGLQRQQSELQNNWQARQHQLSAANLGMQYSQAAQAAQNAAASRANAASQQEWNRMKDIWGMMGGLNSANVGSNLDTYNTALGGYMAPQQMALQMAGNSQPSNSGLGSFLGGLGGVASAFLGNKSQGSPVSGMGGLNSGIPGMTIGNPFG